jgi:hypothetical protein
MALAPDENLPSKTGHVMLSEAKHLSVHRARPFASRWRDHTVPMLGVKIHKEPFGASCILSIRGKPSPACPLTSRLLTTNRDARPAPLRIGPCRGGSGVERSGGLYGRPCLGPCRPPCPSAQPSSHERTPRGPQKHDKVLCQQTTFVPSVPSVSTATSTPPTTTSTTPGELAGAWESDPNH